MYQPGDGTVLHRYRFAPDPAVYGSGPYPTALMIPPVVFKLEYDDEGVTSERWATKDLQDAGFLVFQIEHRLAPDGQLEGQPDHTEDPAGEASGRPPEQTDDVKRQILAALDDPDCNQSIYLIGGSSGACHALWVALDPATGAVSGWNDTVRRQIKAVVGLSGVYDLGSREYGDPGTNFDPDQYVADIENYTNTELMMEWLYIQEAASPMSLVANAPSIPPVMLYASENDTIPNIQSVNMKTALQNAGASVVEYTLPEIGYHAFHYWHKQNRISVPQDCVSHQVIAFLQAHP